MDPAGALTAAASGRVGDGGIRAVSRALQVLAVFTADRMTVSPADLVRETGLPRTTVLRLVDTLAADAMLDIGSDGQIRVGTRLLSWAVFADAAWAAPAATMRRLQNLAAETGETVSVYVRQKLRRVVIAQSPSPHSLRHVVQVGDELELWGGASAMVLLGLEPADIRDDLIRQIAAAPNSGADAGTVCERVDLACRDRWAISHGAREAGNSGLAVPVPRVSSSPPLARPVALGLGGPTARFTDDRVPGFVDALRAAARDIASIGLAPALY